MIRKYLIGTDGAAPIAVRIFRGALEIGLLAAFGFLAVNVNDLIGSIPSMPLDWAGPAGLIAGSIIVSIEGWIDQNVDPAQNRFTPDTQSGNARIGERGQSNAVGVFAFAVLVLVVAWLAVRADILRVP